jgi:isopentenyl-diphosphate delta-isomerase
VRSFAPDIPLFANIGAVQLNYSYGIAQCLEIVELLQADALILHFNPLQECIQPQGDRNFKGLLDKIHDICCQISVPVIAKEVGNGISGKMACQLIQAGVKAIMDSSVVWERLSAIGGFPPPTVSYKCVPSLRLFP